MTAEERASFRVEVEALKNNYLAALAGHRKNEAEAAEHLALLYQLLGASVVSHKKEADIAAKEISSDFKLKLDALEARIVAAQSKHDL